MVVKDERYQVIKGRRWRRSDPAIPPALGSELVHELMDARRAVKAAKRNNDDAAERAARERVQDAKVALGERGRAWWLPQDEEALKKRLAAAIRSLLRKRDIGKTICPSDAARIAAGPTWRDQMDATRAVAWELADEGWLEVTQRGKPVSPPVKGPIRLRRTR